MPQAFNGKAVKNKSTANNYYPKFLYRFFTEEITVISNAAQLFALPPLASGFVIVEPTIPDFGVGTKNLLYLQDEQAILIVYTNGVASVTTTTTTLAPPTTLPQASTTATPCPPTTLPPCTAPTGISASVVGLELVVSFMPTNPLPRWGYGLRWKKSTDTAYATVFSSSGIFRVPVNSAASTYEGLLYPVCFNQGEVSGLGFAFAATALANTTLAPTTTGLTTTSVPGVYPPYTPPPAGWHYSSNGSSLNLGNWFNLPMPVTSQYEGAIAQLDLVNYTLS